VIAYRGLVQGRVERTGNVPIIEELYKVLIPAISSSTPVEAKVLTQPGSTIFYSKGDMVVVGQIDDTGDYIILGLVQKRGIDVPKQSLKQMLK